MQGDLGTCAGRSAHLARTRQHTTRAQLGIPWAEKWPSERIARTVAIPTQVQIGRRDA